MPLSAGAAEPISPEAFARLMAAIADFEPQPKLLVAVSGGSDSLALVLLAAEWAQARGGEVLAVTVDHRVRAESAAEAAQVGLWLARRAIAHRIIPLDATLVRSRRVDQDWLRQLRHRALAEVAREEGALHLLFGHHREDQAETLILRLGRGSGVNGLAAMQPRVFSAGFQTLRPLLGVASLRLRATLVAAGQDWISDPSNQDAAYERIKVRQAAPQLAELGLTGQRLADSAQRLAEARSFLADHRERFLAHYGLFHPAGFVRLIGLPWPGEPRLVLRDGLAQLLQRVSGQPYPPRAASLDRLLGRLLARQPVDGCLSGCRLVTHGSELLIFREASAAEPAAQLTGSHGELSWDRRFLVRWSDLPAGDYTIGTLTPAETARWRPRLLAEAIPKRIMPSLPAIRNRTAILALPCLPETMNLTTISVEPLN